FVLQRHAVRAGKYKVGYQSCDDSTAQSGNFDFATCGANANAYARDSDLVGVIGPIDSSCAQIEIPIMNRAAGGPMALVGTLTTDRKSTRLNSSHVAISYAVFCLKKKTTKIKTWWYIYCKYTYP